MRVTRAAAALVMAAAVVSACGTQAGDPAAAPSSTGTQAAAIATSTTAPATSTAPSPDATTKAAIAEVSLTVDELRDGFVVDVPMADAEYTALGACLGQTLTSDFLQGSNGRFGSWQHDGDHLYVEQYVVAYGSQDAVSVIEEIRAAAAACPDYTDEDGSLWVNEDELPFPTPQGAEASHVICRAASKSADSQWYGCVATVARGRYLSWVTATAPTVPGTQLLAAAMAAAVAESMSPLPATR